MATLKIKLIIILGFLTLFNTNILKAEKSNFNDSLEIKFNQFVENWLNTNIENDKKGLSSLNEYIAYVKVEHNKLQFLTGCLTNPAFIKGEPDETVLTSRGIDNQLCSAYRDFCNNNPSNVQNYIIIVDYPDWYLNTEIPEGQKLSGQPLDYLWKNTAKLDQEKYNSKMKILSDRISPLLSSTLGSVFSSGKHKIVTIIASWDYKANVDNKPIVAYRGGFTPSSFLTEKTVNAYFNSCFVNNEGSFKGSDFLNATMNYFNNYVDPNISCVDLANSFPLGSCARNYVNTWCPTIETAGNHREKIVNMVFQLATYIKNYSFLCPTGNWEDETNMTPGEYLIYLQSHPYLDYIDRKKKLILDQCGQPLTAQTANSFAHIVRTTDKNLLLSLSYAELVCFTNLYLNIYEHPVFHTILNNKDYFYFKYIFNAANEKLTNAEAGTFLANFQSQPNSMIRLWGACNHYFDSNQGNEAELIQVINNLALKANNLVTEQEVDDKMNDLYTNESSKFIIPWEPESSAVTELLQGNKLTQKFDVSRNADITKFNFGCRYCTLANPPITKIEHLPNGQEWEYLVPASCETYGKVIYYTDGPAAGAQHHYPALNPFDIVFITNTANLSFFVDQNKNVCPMTAFSLGWINHQYSNEQITKVFQVAGTILIVVIAPYAYGPLLAGGVAAKVFAGLLIGNSLILANITNDDIITFAVQYVSPEFTDFFISSANEVKEGMTAMDLASSFLSPEKAVTFINRFKYISRAKFLRTTNGDVLIKGSGALMDKVATLEENLKKTLQNYGVLNIASNKQILGLNKDQFVDTSIRDLIILADSPVNSTKSAILTKLNGYSDDVLNRLKADLDDIPGLKKYLAENGDEAMDAWRFIDDIPNAVKCATN